MEIVGEDASSSLPLCQTNLALADPSLSAYFLQQPPVYDLLMVGAQSREMLQECLKADIAPSLQIIVLGLTTGLKDGWYPCLPPL